MKEHTGKVIASWGIDRRIDSHTEKTFDSLDEAMIYIQEHVFDGVCFWVDDWATDEVVCYGVVGSWKLRKQHAE